MKQQFYRDSIDNNNNIDDRYNSSASKEINIEQKNKFLNKYRQLYGNSFSDVELSDIINKNNYIESKIKADIKALLEINDSRKYEYSGNKEEHYSPSFGQSSNTKKIKIIKISNEKIKKNIYFNSPKKETKKDTLIEEYPPIGGDYGGN